jgi:hypothetical protein
MDPLIVGAPWVVALLAARRLRRLLRRRPSRDS